MDNKFLWKNKIESFQTIFDRPEETFIAGQNMTGKVQMTTKEALRVLRITLQCYGKGKVKWFDNSATGDGADPVYRGQEIYINKTETLYESSGSQGDLLPKGVHDYSFDFELPQELPSSFEGEYGHVRYYCSAVIISPQDTNRKNYIHEKIISICRPLDLNSAPMDIRASLVAEDKQTVTCCCIISGSVSVRFHLDRRAYVPGEDLRWKAEVRQSAGTSVVKRCSVTLKQFIDYTGVSDAFFSSGRPKAHYQSSSVCSSHRSGGRPGEPIIWEGSMPVPPIPPSRLDGCRLMSISYSVQFKAVINWGKDIRVMSDVVIGTIPLVNHFRPPPSKASSAYDDKCAVINTSIGPAVSWELPPVVFESCPIKHGQKKLPDPNGDPSEGRIKFTPRYPVYRSQTHFSGPPRKP